jgi:hypothetical protein
MFFCGSMSRCFAGYPEEHLDRSTENWISYLRPMHQSPIRRYAQQMAPGASAASDRNSITKREQLDLQLPQLSNRKCRRKHSRKSAFRYNSKAQFAFL